MRKNLKYYELVVDGTPSVNHPVIEHVGVARDDTGQAYWNWSPISTTSDVPRQVLSGVQIHARATARIEASTITVFTSRRNTSRKVRARTTPQNTSSPSMMSS